LRGRSDLQGALHGINAVVVGILLSAVYDPLWTSAILPPLDVVLAAGALLALGVWRVPPWIVVALTAVGGAVIGPGG
jgi:chromate transporter